MSTDNKTINDTELDIEQRIIRTIRDRFFFFTDPCIFNFQEVDAQALTFVFFKEKVRSAVSQQIIERFLQKYGEIKVESRLDTIVDVDDEFEECFDAIRNAKITINNATTFHVHTLTTKNPDGFHRSYYIVCDNSLVADVKTYIRALAALRRELASYAWEKTRRFGLSNSDEVSEYFSTSACRTWLASVDQPQIKIHITSAVKEFYDDLDRFFAVSKPPSKLSLCKRGYCLWGDPGTGKSLSVENYANTTGIRLFRYRLDDPYESQQSLVYFMNKVIDYTPAIVLFDDLDKLVSQFDENEKASTFNTLLYTLDARRDYGNGLAFIVTTNDIGMFQQALRPGRLDRKIHFVKLDGAHLADAARELLPPDSVDEFLSKCRASTVAQLTLIADSIIMGSDPSKAISEILEETRISERTTGFGR